MKILHAVASYTPSVDGMQEVVRQLSERLVEMGHDVTVATIKLSNRTNLEINGVKIKEFDMSGNFVTGLRGEVEEYRQFLLNSDFDIVTNFAAQQVATDVALPILSRIKAKKVFVPTGFSAFYNPEFYQYFEHMKNWMKEYDMNVFLSDDYRDINFAKDNSITKRMLIPNGADENEFLNEDNHIDVRAKFNIAKDDFLIFSVGTHTGQKGHKEAIEIFEKADVKNATFFINANKTDGGCTNYCLLKEKEFNQSDERLKDNKRLIINFPPRNETVALYKEADLFFFTSNIECSPIVLFESMASQTPFLVTDVGNSKEIIEWSNGGLLLPTDKNIEGYGKVKIPEAVEMLEEIYKDKSKRESLASNGFNAWKERFTWGKIAKDYEQLYSSLLKELVGQSKNKNSNVNITAVISGLKVEEIKQSLQLLQNQTVQPDTIIISTSKEVVENLTGYKSSIKLEMFDTLEDKSRFITRLNEDKSDYIFLLDSSDLIENDLIESLTEKFAHSRYKALGLVYRNFYGLNVNKNLEHKFMSFEFDFSFQGQIFSKLLNSNKYLTSLSGCLIKTEAFIKAGGFDVSLNACQDWDLWLRVAESYEIDYIFSYNEANRIPLYDKTLLTNDVQEFANELNFYNKWVTSSKKADTHVNKWRNFIGWKIHTKFPQTEFLKTATVTLLPNTKRKLFSKTLGSIKLFLIVYFLITYIKIAFKNVVWLFKLAQETIGNLFLILTK